MALTKKEIHQIIAYPNVTPVWLLPYMRMLRGPAQGDYLRAYKLLRYVLPRNVRLPSKEIVSLVLARHELG